MNYLHFGLNPIVSTFRGQQLYVSFYNWGHFWSIFGQENDGRKTN